MPITIRPHNHEGNKMDILQATKSYEAWMRDCTKVIEPELTLKHAQMRADLFMFLRGTYYRWAQLWPEVCKDLRNAPKLLGLGDLHVGSYGTWRDGEGRMCWGIDDFDDSYPLPYASDLVRLAASVKMLTDSQGLTIKFRDGCDAILEGYQESLAEGGSPFVLAEHEKNLERLGIEAIKPPQDFWGKLLQDPVVKRRQIPSDARRVLGKTLPPKVPYKLVRREAGMGSLGQLRFVAIAEYEGGYVAREAKATVPSASVWKEGERAHRERYYEKAIMSAVRSHDPYHKVFGSWLIRRLSPDSNPIEIDDLPKKRDEYTLLHAMGREAANVHLGTRKQVKNVLKDLRRREKNWLRRAAKEMAKLTEREWKEYKKG
jgi:Uncharacterized protein conserved in bacteria (DUF2252)